MSDFEREVSENSRAWMRTLGSFSPTVNPEYREVKGYMLGESGEGEKTYFDSRELRALAAACNEVADWLDARALLAQPAEQPSAANQYPLPDDLYPGSKDWQAADYAGRVEWLHAMYQSAKHEIERLENSLIAKQEQPSAAKVPDGWRLVPVEPTAEMIAAAVNKYPCSLTDTYRVMLAAAPQPAAEQGEATPEPRP